MDSGGAVARKGAAGTEPSNALAILAVTDLSGTSNELSPAVDTLSQPPPPPAETNKEGAGKEWPLVSTPSIAGEFGWNVAPHRRPWVPIVPFQFIPTQQVCSRVRLLELRLPLSPRGFPRVYTPMAFRLTCDVLQPPAVLSVLIDYPVMSHLGH